MDVAGPDDAVADVAEGVVAIGSFEKANVRSGADAEEDLSDEFTMSQYASAARRISSLLMPRLIFFAIPTAATLRICA